MCIPCLLGLEGLLAGELRHLKMNGVTAENGRVWFSGGPAAAVAANLWVRTGERVLIELGAFPAETYDALFEGVKALPWEALIPAGGAFPVKGHCLNSRLMSVPDCQRIIKKAAAERLKQAYHLQWCPEDGAEYPIRFLLMKDRASVCLDTTGAPLYRRGYRPQSVAAPLRETLAAGLVAVAGYRGKGDFADPFCGSGTLPIEAALSAKNRAPGLNRRFAGVFSLAVAGSQRRGGEPGIPGRIPHLCLGYRSRGGGAGQGERPTCRRGRTYRLFRGGRRPVYPEDGAGMHRHQSALRQTYLRSERGRGHLCRLRESLARRRRGLEPLPALRSHGV